MSTKRLNISGKLVQLSQEVEVLADGERLLLCKRNQPVAEVVRLAPQAGSKGMQIGVALGQCSVPESFDDGSDEIADLFESSEL